ncbi:MAG TPA: hypothetical protein VIM71_11910 [Lacunisphaera sp.]
MIKTTFDWLDLHPASYWFIALAPSLALIARVIILIRQESRGPAVPSRSSVWVDATLLFLFLFAWRWPFLLVSHDFNPDESQLIAGAITLTHDPVFWRSVDGTTSGPLNFYALLPLHWLGLPLDYFSARLTGLLLIWGTLLACQRTLTRRFGATMGWLGILPAAGFFATVTHSDLIHYSSEHLSLLLIASSVWLLALREPGDRIRWWTALLIAGLAPWAKLQSVPLAFVLIGWACVQGLREASDTAAPRVRCIASAALASLAPTLIAASLIVATGQAEAAYRRYFLHNLIYVDQGAVRTVTDALREMLGLAMIDGRFPLLLATALTIILVAGAGFAWRRVRPPVLFVVGGVLTVSATLAVIMPRREFLHYTLWLTVPLTLWLGASAGGWWNRLASFRARWLLALTLLWAAGLPPLLTRARHPVPDIFEAFAYHWRHPRNPTAMVVHALAGREDTLAVWGWAPNLYVETHLRQATRDAHSVWCIVPSAQRDYHRRDYLADLQRHEPAVFVDAVGPGAFAFEHRQVQAHEIFPELADYISKHYTLVRDVRDARIYARNDLATLRELSATRIDLLLAQGRNSGTNLTPPAITPLEKLTRKVIDYRQVMMILPPTLVEWQLEDDVREVSLEFGFDPVAYEQGRSNGAEIILELVSFDQTRRVFSRLLDPARRSADRGRQAARITLPPFTPGTHLVLRTSAGESGDNAWDWLYFTNLNLHRSPTFLPRQFPGFNRVPDLADAGSSGLLEDEHGSVLQLHTPASIVFLLDGTERRLNFQYGFRPGSYDNGGHTDGAIYRVEITGPGQPKRVLFERYLRPSQQTEDRGTQTANVALPAIKRGDQLIISLDPGPSGSAAWDWTYISRLNLK